MPSSRSPIHAGECDVQSHLRCICSCCVAYQRLDELCERDSVLLLCRSVSRGIFRRKSANMRSFAINYKRCRLSLCHTMKSKRNVFNNCDRPQPTYTHSLHTLLCSGWYKTASTNTKNQQKKTFKHETACRCCCCCCCLCVLNECLYELFVGGHGETRHLNSREQQHSVCVTWFAVVVCSSHARELSACAPYVCSLCAHV